jgi:phosphomannomutase
MTDLYARARAFRDDDPDAQSRAALDEILTAAEGGDETAREDLEERFSGRLSFGTAGLRGAMGPGTQRMNRVVVSQASWGLGTYLLEQGEDVRAKERGVVIAFDGRRGSRQFAEDTAAVLAGLGIPCHVFADTVPTPVASFAVTHLDAAAGVMVTASHNPPADNGYKVYWGNGAQIVPPHDKGIAACIDRAPAVAAMARPPVFDAAASGLRQRVPDSVEREYLDGVKAGSFRPGVGEKQPLRIVYTAMHGVGNRFVMRALEEAGFAAVHTVPVQAEPDGTFHTVSFPNPEEPGALDIAMSEADAVGADLILAHDPDADRIAVCLKNDDGAWRMLSGNETGVLLCADALENADTGGEEKLVVTTIVSSTWLSRVAKNLGAHYGEVLTGFKWIANAAIDAKAKGISFVCGYEEALGVSVGPLVRDKDGVSAAVRVAELAASLRLEGRSLLDRLDELAVKHGVSVAEQWSVVLPGSEGSARIAEALGALRADPPAEVAGVAIERRVDMARDGDGDGWERGDLPASNVLVFFDADGTRITVRPSGSEPKIKFYLEAAGRVSDVGALPAKREELRAQLKKARAELMERVGL